MAVQEIFYHGRFGALAIAVAAETSIKRLVVAWRNLVFPRCNQPCCAIPRHEKYYPRHHFLRYELIAVITAIKSICKF